jgi:DNA-directed RNA polymerase specialized sigma24 family protein
MDADPDGVTTDDWALVTAARAGDRLAFGLLYLRHHAAAWRVACVSSRFSPDAELAVIEGFTRIFSALPAETEPLASASVSFRPYVLACVRQSALDRARAAGREETGDEAPAALAGLGPDGEVVLSSLEHHVARAALAALPERWRTALWLTDVEALTPAEVGGILLGPTPELAALAADARVRIHSAQESALDRQEVRAGCRYTVDRLDSYQAGGLDPAEGLDVRSHLETCPPCRMRQGELANAPAALAAAVPAAPLLGGEAQHNWLASAADLAPATHLLPPGLAAGGAAPRPTRARRTATRLGTAAGAAMAPALRLPAAVRRAGRAAAGHWRSGPDAIDLTTRSALLRSTERPAPPRAPGPAGAPPDPTVPRGWTGSPGWSGSPVPSVPPAWTTPPGRTIGPRPPASMGDRLGATGRRRDRRIGSRVAAGRLGDRQIGNQFRAAGRPLARGGGLTARARRAGRSGRPALPAAGLVVAWFVVMAALPWLMTPGTAPGPSGLALPAVQAYVPGYSPGGAPGATTGAAHPAGSALSSGSSPSGAAESPTQMTTGPGLQTAVPTATALGDEPAVILLATAASQPGGHHANSSRHAPPASGPIPAPVGPSLTAALAPVTAAVTPPVGPTPAETATTTPTRTTTPTAGPNLAPTSVPAGTGAITSQPAPKNPGMPGSKRKNKKHGPAGRDGPNTSGTAAASGTPATVPDRPAVTTAERPSDKPARGRDGTRPPAVPRVRILEA